MNGLLGLLIGTVSLLVFLVFSTSLSQERKGMTLPQKEDSFEEFSVDQLSPAEVEQVKNADAEFSKAQEVHESKLNVVKRIHGQNTGDIMYPYGLSCGQILTSVQIRGKYALITRTRSTSGCPVPAIEWYQFKGSH